QCAACHGNDHRGTRLSRTPVDRSFVTEKGKTVRGKAGDAIGCDLCHSVRKSCTGSPNPDCGKPSEQVAGTTNQAPVFATQPPSEALIGKDYRYAVHANDPEGEAIRYSTSWLAAGGLPIDPQSGVLSIAAANLTGLPQNVDHEFAATDGHYPPFLLELRIIATDARGAYAVQPVKIGVDCPADLIWSSAEAACAPIGIISSPTTNGLNEGEIYTYAVKAETRGGAPVTYGLSEGPEGMHIDAATGLLSWVAIPSPGYGFNFTVTATDGQGHTASQSNIVLVCTKPDQWDTGRTGRGCVPLITLSSQPSRPGLNVGESYDYRLEAIHREGLPLTFTLDQPPLGMTIDGKTGALHWIAQAESSTTLYPRIDITDSNGYSISQTLNVTVCAPPDRWREEAQQCHGPIDFTSESPVAGLVAGETFDYAVTATHREGLPIAFALTNAPADMSFDAKTCVLHWVAASNSDGYISFTITASDSRGASTTQDVGLSICASGMRWDVSLGCQGPVVIEPQTVFGIDAGATYTYAVKASLPGGGPISFGLADAPAGMAIDSASGVVTWVAVANPNAGSPFGFTVIASDDQGRQTIQYGNLMVCESPQHWNNEAAACQ
ncbi:MAG: hypothetical protein FIA97_17440, partial [Methylococcaceae bacterium]|nr:hypothetical protein [Methylococcaceae bacterium]